jgi:hypothetical protein
MALWMSLAYACIVSAMTRPLRVEGARFAHCFNAIGAAIDTCILGQAVIYWACPWGTWRDCLGGTR